MKEVVLAFEKVQPEAACRTCCFEGIMEKLDFAKKSLPRIGVATAASKKSKSKFWPEKQTVQRRKPQEGIGLPLAPTRCGPVGGAVLVCSKTDNDVPNQPKI